MFQAHLTDVTPLLRDERPRALLPLAHDGACRAAPSPALEDQTRRPSAPALDPHELAGTHARMVAARGTRRALARHLAGAVAPRHIDRPLHPASARRRDGRRRGIRVRPARRGGSRGRDALGGSRVRRAARRARAGRLAIVGPASHRRPRALVAAYAWRTAVLLPPRAPRRERRWSRLTTAARVGFRDVADPSATDDGFALHVNGVPVFCRGACWTAADILSLRAPRGASARAPSTLLRDAGVNMVRVGGTMVYESDDFYRALRRAGHPGVAGLHVRQHGLSRERCGVRQLESTAEAASRSRRLQRHPSVAAYCGGQRGRAAGGDDGAAARRMAQTASSPRCCRELVRALASRRRRTCPRRPGAARCRSTSTAASRTTTAWAPTAARSPTRSRAEVRFAHRVPRLCQRARAPDVVALDDGG